MAVGEEHQDNDEVQGQEGCSGMTMVVHREGCPAFPVPGGSLNPPSFPVFP